MKLPSQVHRLPSKPLDFKQERQKLKISKKELFILFGFKGKNTSCQSEYLAFVISKSMFSVRNTAEVFSLVYYDQHFWDRILRCLFVNIQKQKLHPQELDLQNKVNHWMRDRKTLSKK